jgi:hypothetical protein
MGEGSMMESELPPKCPTPLYLLRQINAATVVGKKQQDEAVYESLASVTLSDSPRCIWLRYGTR